MSIPSLATLGDTLGVERAPSLSLLFPSSPPPLSKRSTVLPKALPAHLRLLPDSLAFSVLSLHFCPECRHWRREHGDLPAKRFVYREAPLLESSCALGYGWPVFLVEMLLTGFHALWICQRSQTPLPIFPNPTYYAHGSLRENSESPFLHSDFCASAGERRVPEQGRGPCVSRNL